MFTCATFCQLDATEQLKKGLDDLACNTFTLTDSLCMLGVTDPNQRSGSQLNVWSLPPGKKVPFNVKTYLTLVTTTEPGIWSEWMPSSACSTTCGPGTLLESRNCSRGSVPPGTPFYCDGQPTRTANCLLLNCPGVLSGLCIIFFVH